MIHPFIRLLISRPGLLAEHAGAYIELAAHDAATWKGATVKRLACIVVVALCAALAIGFGGFALMLWGASTERLWLLWVVPLVPVLLALVAWIYRERGLSSSAFSNLRAQFEADVKMLKETL